MCRFFLTSVMCAFICFNMSAGPLFIQLNEPTKEIVYINDQSSKLISDIKLEKSIIEQRAAKIQKKNDDLIFVLSLVAIIALVVLIFLIIVIRKKIAKYKNLYLESNHRIKNNLGAIDYFISKKKEVTTSEEVKANLADVQSKLYSFYKIHESLVINESKNSIALKDYLSDLLLKTTQSFGGDKVFFQTEMKTSIHIDINKTCVLGMILNEFITNSIAHASFYGIPNIFVSLEESNKSVILKIVEKNKTKQLSVKRSSSTQKGLRLVKNLCKQIDAKLITNNNQGMQMLITLER